jgi:hypothetical protein
VHPKDALYDEVYGPFTVVWFDELDQSPRRAMLLAEAGRHDLLHNLEELNSLIHELVDASFDALGDKLEYMLAVVRRYRDHVLWEGQKTPVFDAKDEQIRAALNHKLKRNFSMGAIETVICLEAATTFCKEQLGLSGRLLANVLRLSGQLGASLALLHDQQEQHRLHFLTGEEGYLQYPEVTFADVIAGGRYRIPPEMFVVVGSGDDLRVRFVSHRVEPGPFQTPIKRCPAYNFPSSYDRSVPLNEDLWRLIVDIYRLSGRLA